jgi:hypothetical protein
VRSPPRLGRGGGAKDFTLAGKAAVKFYGLRQEAAIPSTRVYISMIIHKHDKYSPKTKNYKTLTRLDTLIQFL